MDAVADKPGPNDPIALIHPNPVSNESFRVANHDAGIICYVYSKVDQMHHVFPITPNARQDIESFRWTFRVLVVWRKFVAHNCDSSVDECPMLEVLVHVFQPMRSGLMTEFHVSSDRCLVLLRVHDTHGSEIQQSGSLHLQNH